MFWLNNMDALKVVEMSDFDTSVEVVTGSAYKVLVECKTHLSNLQNFSIVILIAVGLCFGALCCIVLSYYLKR